MVCSLVFVVKTGPVICANYPFDSCARSICGVSAKCHAVRITGYYRDYVCIYDNGKKYGFNYEKRNVINDVSRCFVIGVQNPCMKSCSTFHLFEFNRYGYLERVCGSSYLFS